MKIKFGKAPAGGVRFSPEERKPPKGPDTIYISWLPLLGYCIEYYFVDTDGYEKFAQEINIIPFRCVIYLLIALMCFLSNF